MIFGATLLTSDAVLHILTFAVPSSTLLIWKACCPACPVFLFPPPPSVDFQGTNSTVEYSSFLYQFCLFFTPCFLLSWLSHMFIGLPPLCSVSFILLYPFSPDRTISALIFSGYPLSHSLSLNLLRLVSFSANDKSGWQFLNILMTSCDRVVRFICSGIVEWNNINCQLAMAFR